VIGVLGVLGLLLALPVIAIVIYLAVLYVNGADGQSYVDGEPVSSARSKESVEREQGRQRVARSLLARSGSPQILFGDLHVHTHYSADAHLQSIRIKDREGASPPADACDFARFCSQLDFWSINDHAESLTPDHWRETVEAIQQCNEVAGDPENPDLVSFLGWEWSHQSVVDASFHYGHKNVVLRDYEAGRVPVRPIASISGPPWLFLAIGAVAPWFSEAGLEDWVDFHRYTRDVLDVPDCPEGVAVRDLPSDCRESAKDPRTLFAKLSDWGLPAVVIPHGLSWGTTNPAHAKLDNQIAQHDSVFQPLLEVYSGHGNSEVFRDFRLPEMKADASYDCPADGEDMELCCERAARLARARCEDPDSEACEIEIQAAMQATARFEGSFGNVTLTLPETDPADWGECGQLQNAFLPAFDYRPRQSAQYSLALGRDLAGTTDARFRWGFIGSSDSHRARPGTGYREFARELMTDGVDYPIPPGLEDERSKSYYYTGGLAAVHAEGRDRGAIFDALRSRRVYGTSGDRILLWFDLLREDGTRLPMGSEASLAAVPRFEVRALGAFEQQAGCPDFATQALTRDRLESLCRGECYHPGEVRKSIARVEVVRIRPQRDSEEAIRPLIEDPWLGFDCPALGEGCIVEFEDPDFVRDRRESVYYVRVIQSPSPAVNGDPLRCDRDANGVCVRGHPCGRDTNGLPEDCLAEVGERAWSSPIFVDPS